MNVEPIPGAEAGQESDWTTDAVDDEGDTIPWRDLHDETVLRLTAIGIEGAEREARWLVERAAGDPLRMVLDEPVRVRSHHHWRLMIERRETGEPIQYVLGQWSFRTLELFVDKRVLIPRPETEVVAGVALDEHARVGGVVVDLGVGSGAIALSIAAERPGTEVWGVDASPSALEVARANLAGLGRRARSVRLEEGSWYEPLPDSLRGEIGVIVSNPPYVTDAEPLPSLVENWEPVSALRAGSDGLDDIRVVVRGAVGWLAPGGALVVEHAPSQSEAIRALAVDAGFDTVETGQDLTGRDRYLLARR